MVTDEHKKKIAIYFSPDTVERLDMAQVQTECRSRSEFVNKAVNFYCGYVTAENYKEYFPDVIISTMKATLDSFEDRMASLLFKIAVELSMLLNVTAANCQVEADELAGLRGYCVNEVRRLNGLISFEDALRKQRK